MKPLSVWKKPVKARLGFTINLLFVQYIYIMHLADASIQSDIQFIQAIHLLSVFLSILCKQIFLQAMSFTCNLAEISHH